jgi:uncharacterized membrane protein YhaH (DUF805 family)
MNLVTLFFSFRGRASRSGYWFVSLTWFAVTLVPGADVWELATGHNYLLAAGLVMVGLALIASALAISIRRLHDRGKSGWWIAIFLSPLVLETIASVRDLDAAVMVPLMVLSLVITFWAFVELGLLPGTAGPNRYGPDPHDEPLFWRRA